MRKMARSQNNGEKNRTGEFQSNSKSNKYDYTPKISKNYF